MLIEATKDFQGDPGVIWGRVSDVARIPEYWHGTKSLRVIGKSDDGGKVVADTKFAFGGSGKVEITTDQATKTLAVRYISGPFTGTQTVKVAGTRLEAKWDIEFHGMFRIMSGRTVSHFKSGTDHALERLSEGVGQQPHI
jgi:ribosome-associated toxin RatA of RatAB toxin-antitoxin module